MSEEPFFIQLTWQDPETGDRQDCVFPLPIAFGRDEDAMPKTVENKTVTPVVLNHKKVSRFHALITLEGKQILLTDHSVNGTRLHNHLLQQGTLPLQSQDQIEIGPYPITLTLVNQTDPQATEPETARRSALNSQTPVPSTPWWSQSWIISMVGALMAGCMAVGTWALMSWLLEKSRPSRPTVEEAVSLELHR
ncbi:MAG: FHA domain-containing protein [Roseofilum sp. SBFL]|uniref:FHA domain-containing protein n=1 Tax=unclassified Roseofilum TaxID=2620099 RepID=UPI001B2AAD91|nr:MULTISPECIES: FHA domain-containing protein [unclassified Roseofilum]MBP0014669.1 FHA domain-containing protein [Roseofilum sp. SID3]MBP0023353.1 FHA domain-containing protein [Roseofilum sp. SID2]MBP0039667.1 FHA domain-containing protein [Roseofilum sp. SID1]MBP0042842.1 FHA domain-containing protein [Roseofilum sp. SBFL]